MHMSLHKDQICVSWIRYGLNEGCVHLHKVLLYLKTQQEQQVIKVG